MGAQRQWQAGRGAMLSVRQLGAVAKGKWKLLEWDVALWHNPNYF